MIRSGTASLGAKAEDPLEFARSSIEDILAKSAAHSDSVKKLEAEGVDVEQEIFAQNDLDIRSFDGIKFTSGVQIGRAWKQHNQVNPEDIMLGKRDRAARVVNVGGHMVLKESINNEGGEAVKTLSGSADAKAKRAREQEGRQSSKKPRDWIHDDTCFFCHDGGTIITCSRCPRSYHPKCVGMTSSQVKRATMWTCPQHHCMTCGRNTADAGGLIYRCITCPVGFCEDHLPHEDTIEPIGDENPALAARGYRRIKQAYWIQCDVCVTFFDNIKKRQEEDLKLPGEAKAPLENKPHEENPDDFIPEDPEEVGDVVMVEEDELE
jgi:SWI/SNF-related matrix-associated actin-dependent regulator of chromatin subfamily A member 5